MHGWIGLLVSLLPMAEAVDQNAPDLSSLDVVRLSMTTTCPIVDPDNFRGNIPSVTFRTVAGFEAGADRIKYQSDQCQLSSNVIHFSDLTKRLDKYFAAHSDQVGQAIRCADLCPDRFVFDLTSSSSKAENQDTTHRGKWKYRFLDLLNGKVIAVNTDACLTYLFTGHLEATGVARSQVTKNVDPKGTSTYDYDMDTMIGGSLPFGVLVTRRPSKPVEQRTGKEESIGGNILHWKVTFRLVSHRVSTRDR